MNTVRRLQHLEFLKHMIFNIDSKWPQFRVMFEALESNSALINKATRVLILERCYFYGGYSLFKPLFDNNVVKVVDCLNASANERKGAQASWVDHPHFIKTFPDFELYPEEMAHAIDDKFDFVFIPNVIHHVRDQYKLFQQINAVLAPGGNVMVFEGLVRELHHLPADYIRYTPFGLEYMFETSQLNMDMDKTAYGSGVFDVLSYTLQMASEYLPENARDLFSTFYNGFLYDFLQDLDRNFPRNLQKPDKSFPMSYVVWASKGVTT